MVLLSFNSPGEFDRFAYLIFGGPISLVVLVFLFFAVRKWLKALVQEAVEKGRDGDETYAPRTESPLFDDK